MFLLCILGIDDPEQNNWRPWPGNDYTWATMGEWFEAIKGSKTFYYILLCEYKR